MLTTVGVLLAAGADSRTARGDDAHIPGHIHDHRRGAARSSVVAAPRPARPGPAAGRSRSSDVRCQLLDRFGRVLSPFIPHREGSTRTTLAALLTSADTDALATTDEMAVVSGVLAFADRPVRGSSMTPRTAIVALPEGHSHRRGAAHVLQQSGYSRYPVYRGSLDEVVGVAHTLDLLGRQPGGSRFWCAPPLCALPVRYGLPT